MKKSTTKKSSRKKSVSVETPETTTETWIAKALQAAPAVFSGEQPVEASPDEIASQDHEDSAVVVGWDSVDTSTEDTTTANHEENTDGLTEAPAAATENEENQFTSPVVPVSLPDLSPTTTATAPAPASVGSQPQENNLLTLPALCEIIGRSVDTINSDFRDGHYLGDLTFDLPERQQGTQIDEWETTIAQAIGDLFSVVPVRVKTGWAWLGEERRVQQARNSYRLTRDNIRASLGHKALASLYPTTDRKTPSRLAYYLDLADAFLPMIGALDRTGHTPSAEVLKARLISADNKTYRRADGTKQTYKVYVR